MFINPFTIVCKSKTVWRVALQNHYTSSVTLVLVAKIPGLVVNVMLRPIGSVICDDGLNLDQIYVTSFFSLLNKPVLFEACSDRINPSA